MTRVLLADDHTLVRAGLRKLLESIAGFEVVGEADDGLALLTLVQQQQPDLVLMDIGMPGRDGIDVLKDIKRLKPNLRVLVVSMYPEDQYAVRAIKAGVVHVNTYGGPDITVPLGGVRQSGNGHDKSMHALDKYLDLKTAWIQL